jgi:hypothetical protein
MPTKSLKRERRSVATPESTDAPTGSDRLAQARNREERCAAFNRILWESWNERFARVEGGAR